MFKRSADRVNKQRKAFKRSFRDEARAQLREQLNSVNAGSENVSPKGSIVTLIVGPDKRLFAAHEQILSRASPFFAAACKNPHHGQGTRSIALVDEEPEVLSAILEFLYKGDYTPDLLQNKSHSWTTGEVSDISTRATIYSHKVQDTILRDTAIYCSAERYGIEDLKRLALRKQALSWRVDIPTLLRSARYAYENTPESDSRLRAHYLALIVRCRKAFKRSATMKAEMQVGGDMFFDLFVALCNFFDDVLGASSGSGTVRSI